MARHFDLHGVYILDYIVLHGEISAGLNMTEAVLNGVTINRTLIPCNWNFANLSSITKLHQDNNIIA